MQTFQRSLAVSISKDCNEYLSNLTFVFLHEGSIFFLYGKDATQRFLSHECRLAFGFELQVKKQRLTDIEISSSPFYGPTAKCRLELQIWAEAGGVHCSVEGDGIYHTATPPITTFLHHSPDFSGVLLLRLLIPFGSAFHILFPTCTGLLYFPHFVISCPWAISYNFINISSE